ncbi:MAG TPA: cytidylate kinase-like family protein [Actinomycetota bacterium]|nr:cytidylate kinase-like family protein [Actinomycetota bacterium]
MKGLTSVERYLDSVTRQPQARGWTAPAGGAAVHWPVVTISRQTGAGAHVVADELLDLLIARAPKGSPTWTVFDRNLVDEVLRHHDLPARLATFMREDRVSHVADAMEELFGLHPRASTLVKRTADTILHLAEIGNVILIGRGANLITARLDWAFHVRLVGSAGKRIAYLQGRLHMDPGAAAQYLRAQDLGRQRYVKEYYGRDIDDPLQYDLVINTDGIPYREAARIIADATSLLGSSPEPPS